MTPDDIKALAAELRDTLVAQADEARQAEHDEWEEDTWRRLSTRCRELEARIRDLDETERIQTRALNAATERHAILAEVVAFLDGRITHVVNVGESHVPLIQPAALGFTGPADYGRSRQARLLSLVPQVKRTGTQDDPEWTIDGWKLSTYSDGSGADYSGIIPCHSLEEAQAQVLAMFTADVDLWRRQRAGQVTKNSSSWDTEPMREVVEAVPRVGRSPGVRMFYIYWWDLTLGCGHEEERPRSFPGSGRGFGRLHHTPSSDAAERPAPRRVRCRACARASDTTSGQDFPLK